MCSSDLVGGVPDVVDDGVTGLLVPARDGVQMAAAFAGLAPAHEQRLEMGRRGRERARARYSHTRLVQDIDALYGSALARRRRTT